MPQSHSNKIVIFDLDGTLADITHRLHFIKDGKRNWPAFFKACSEDLPIESLITINQAVYEHWIVWIFSGRSDAVRESTEHWLKLHGVRYNFLRMRPDGDHTKDCDLKESWIDQFELTPDKVVCVFDDRQQVVDMWRRRGFRCLQVAPGNF